MQVDRCKLLCVVVRSWARVKNPTSEVPTSHVRFNLQRLRVMDRLALTATALVVHPEAFPPIHA